MILARPSAARKLGRMSGLSSRSSGLPAVGDLLVLVDEAADTRVELAPQRGALVTSFSVRGRELLYLDQATLADASKNVRGGIPVLFPSPGRLAGDGFTHGGHRYTLAQHGFARNLPWARTELSSSAASVTLALSATDATRAQYPFEFGVQLRFALAGTRLTIGIGIHNGGSEPLPCAVGFHPYFLVHDKRAATIATHATRVFDNVQKAVVPFAGFDLGAQELDLHLLDHGSTASALDYGDGTQLSVRASAEFTRWVVWTVAGKDYVCLEPWSAPADALNNRQDLLHIAPGAVHTGWVELELIG